MASEMKIFVIASLAYSLTNFRGALIAQMIAAGHQVFACAPDVDDIVNADLRQLGAHFRLIPMGRAKLNPLEDARTLLSLLHLLRKEKPDVVLAYTQKPIIYAGLAHRLTRQGRFVPMVTGLGYIFSQGQSRHWLQALVAKLFRLAVSKASTIIAFNADDCTELHQRGMVKPNQDIVVVPGSGVDMAHFVRQPLPPGGPVFLLIARLLRDKGLREFVAAASIVRRRYPNARFQLLGPFDSNPAAITVNELRQWQQGGDIEYLGEARDVRNYLAGCTVFVLPSYREGIPRAVLEAMATGRAVITTDAPGCRETVSVGKNGILVPVRDVQALALAMTQFCEKPEIAWTMGDSSHMIARQRFSVETVNGMLMDIMKLTTD